MSPAFALNTDLIIWREAKKVPLWKIASTDFYMCQWELFLSWIAKTLWNNEKKILYHTFRVGVISGYRWLAEDL